MAEGNTEPNASEANPREPDDGSLSEILDELSNLDPAEQKVIAQVFMARHESTLSAFSSPIPPPEILREYNDLIPNGAERIMVMAEDQNRHRIRLESVVVQGDTKRSYTGLWLGFVISLAVLLLALYAIREGYPTLAGVIVAIDLVALASVFVYGSISRRNERADRREKQKKDGPGSATQE